MQKLFYLIAGLILSTALTAQDKTTPVASSISNVTVFLSGAEIQRNGALPLKAGMQQVVFNNLPANINPQSIQVSGRGNFTILGVSHRINYLQAAGKSSEFKQIEDSLRIVNDQLEQQKAAMNVLASERNMLKANEAIGGTQTGVKLSELSAFADYYRKRLTELNAQRIKVNAALAGLRKDSVRMQKQLNELNHKPQRPTSEIVVDLTVPAPVNAQFTISYLAYDAGWSVSYDLRSAEVNKPIALTYKAQVYQNTGEDWKNVKPVFSTANPTVNSTKPLLNPWYLSFYEPQPVMLAYGVAKAHNRQAPEAAVCPQMKREELLLMDAVAPTAATAADRTSVSESQTSVEFTIDVPYTIASDGQQHAVELANYSLPATYEYYAVRKLEKDVFLLAKTTGWEQLNLLPGAANLFFEGRYVGQSYIETQQTGDTLSLSLGRDKNITVTRTRKKDFAEKQFLSSNITETREWDLSIQNRKSQPVVITVEDQIPVSTTKEIKVETINTSGAAVEAATGKLTWKYTIQPQETKSMNLKYSVKYPKDKKVILE